MKWVVDLERVVVLKTELVIDAPSFGHALDQTHDHIRKMAERPARLTRESGRLHPPLDLEDWDDIDAGDVRVETPVRLLDRRSQQRHDPAFTLPHDECDNCGTSKTHTNDYGGARVCDVCLPLLPPLTG